MRREISPPKVAPPAANYAHAILSEAPSRWLHTAGVVPIALDGSTPDALGEQADLVWTIIAAMLEEAHLAVSDIVSVTTYVVASVIAADDFAGSESITTSLGEVMAARDRALGGHRAASTLVTVPALARPEWKIEVAIVAAR